MKKHVINTSISIVVFHATPSLLPQLAPLSSHNLKHLIVPWVTLPLQSMLLLVRFTQQQDVLIIIIIIIIIIITEHTN
jgi:hypothetical protein